MIGEGIGEPRIGVRGAMMPSSLRLFLVPPILGKRESKGARMDLTRDVRGTVYVNDLEWGGGGAGDRICKQVVTSHSREDQLLLER
jgi:hypothetical protein